MNGLLRATYEVHCAKCERPNLGLPGEMWKAKEELKRDGWKLVKGFYHCAECLKK